MKLPGPLAWGMMVRAGSIDTKRILKWSPQMVPAQCVNPFDGADGVGTF